MAGFAAGIPPRFQRNPQRNRFRHVLIDLMPILSLRSVTKDYVSEGQPVRAVDGVSLDVEAGEFVTLVGRSGCGKSTLLNLAGAMDFLRPAAKSGLMEP